MEETAPPQPRAPSRDVLIVGGGIIGSSLAYFLAAAEAARVSPAGSPGRAPPSRLRPLRITVVERDPTYARSSTALSVGGIRQQFSTPENIILSRYSFDFLRKAPELLAVDGERPDVGLVEAGYLFLATEAGLPVLQRGHQLQTGLGVDVVMLSTEELRERFPWMSTEGLAAGSLGVRGEGWLDPHSLLQAFKAKARSLGVEYIKEEVVAMRTVHHRVDAVRLASAGWLSVGMVVNAAGPRAAHVARMVGITDLPVHPRRRFVYRVHPPQPFPGAPLVVDPSGVYFRPEGPDLLCGVSPRPEDDPDTLELAVEHGLFHEVVWPALARRVPALERLKLGSSWAGLYAVNTADHNAILGPHPDFPNFCLANGFSGHGLQHAPGIGMALSELILFGEYRTLDLRRFGVERLETGALLREEKVV